LKIPVRVYYQDTDAGGVVFHAQYLAFMERARTELLNDAGVDIARFAERHGLLFLVHELSVRYHQPGRLNEMLSVSAVGVKLGRARMKPARIPEELGTALGAVHKQGLK
jgi:acyl-CoA thioester hydrolase